jgi:hypothetical protein
MPYRFVIDHVVGSTVATRVLLCEGVYLSHNQGTGDGEGDVNAISRPARSPGGGFAEMSKSPLGD